MAERLGIRPVIIIVPKDNDTAVCAEVYGDLLTLYRLKGYDQDAVAMRAYELSQIPRRGASPTEDWEDAELEIATADYIQKVIHS